MHTKIICTIGPATNSDDMIKKLIKGGMDIARLNFSHSDWAFHKDAFLKIRHWSKMLKKTVRLMADLSGPKIRIADFSGSPKSLLRGQIINLSLTDGKIFSNSTLVIDDKFLHVNIKPDVKILIDDGKIELKVIKKTGNILACKVVTGGDVYPHKGVNIPMTATRESAITEKDQNDLKFIKKMGFDLVNISFIQSEKDIDKLRKIVGNKMQIVSKIERAQALKNLGKIIEKSDMVMVARGDLGLEVPIEELPILQKMIIKKCNQADRFVITATQMLDSMTYLTHPTRAEATDVANAVLDGTDAVMLSNETSVGKYPIESLQTMVKIVREAEKYIYEKALIL